MNDKIMNITWIAISIESESELLYSVLLWNNHLSDKRWPRSWIQSV